MKEFNTSSKLTEAAIDIASLLDNAAKEVESLKEFNRALQKENYKFLGRLLENVFNIKSTNKKLDIQIEANKILKAKVEELKREVMDRVIQDNIEEAKKALRTTFNYLYIPESKPKEDVVISYIVTIDYNNGAESSLYTYKTLDQAKYVAKAFKGEASITRIYENRYTDKQKFLTLIFLKENK